MVELEENVRRKDLSAYERSKLLTDLADTARAVAREEVGPSGYDSWASLHASRCDSASGKRASCTARV